MAEGGEDRQARARKRWIALWVAWGGVILTGGSFGVCYGVVGRTSGLDVLAKGVPYAVLMVVRLGMLLVGGMLAYVWRAKD